MTIIAIVVLIGFVYMEKKIRKLEDRVEELEHGNKN